LSKRVFFTAVRGLPGQRYARDIAVVGKQGFLGQPIVKIFHHPSLPSPLKMGGGKKIPLPLFRGGELKRG
jgi:hypothetical protein